MDREILFRGRDYMGKWHFGNLLYRKDKSPVPETSQEYEEFYIQEQDFLGEEVEVEPSTIGQYTGLKDCNGKEIYEGDIVLIGEKLKAKVIYYDGAFRMQSEFSPTPIDTTDMGYMMREFSVRVIGNIHDNPELIKKSV